MYSINLSSCLITYYYIIYQEKGKFNNWNQSSNGNVIHKDNVKFPNFSQNAANFPNPMGPGPIPKKGCESPALHTPLNSDLLFP